MPYIALMGEVEQRVVASFREGGGVPYSAYPRFQALQAKETARVYDAALVDTIVPMVPGLTERLSEGIDVLDVGTGQGHAPIVLARAFPNSRFQGLDQSEDGIAAARREADRLSLTTSATRSATRRGSPDGTTWSPPSTSSTTWPGRRRPSTPSPRPSATAASS